MKTPSDDRRMFTAEEVRAVALQIANPGRLDWMTTVLREHGISAAGLGSPSLTGERAS